jgi:antagonist of KipI
VTATLAVLKAGMLTTVQDLGRYGYQGVGVPVAGPMDWYSHRLANRLVGNERTAAALEVTLLGPELLAEGDAMCALAGADFEITIDGRTVRSHEPFVIAGGARLRIGPRRAGARATLAVRGGFELPPTLGSRATHVLSRMGPFGGRALKPGDRLPVGPSPARMRFFSAPPLRVPNGGATVRVLPAAHHDRFTERAWATLASQAFLITPQSNRMGYRLDGPALEHVRGADILSEATPIGAIQVPSSGQPILLMADRQTTGGYTTIANVITADLPIAGQLGPGDWIRFEWCTREDALDALRQRFAALHEP